MFTSKNGVQYQHFQHKPICSTKWQLHFKCYYTRILWTHLMVHNATIAYCTLNIINYWHFLLQNEYSFSFGRYLLCDRLRLYIFWSRYADNLWTGTGSMSGWYKWVWCWCSCVLVGMSTVFITLYCQTQHKSRIEVMP